MTNDIRIDGARRSRTGIAEAVYGPGKSAEQCARAVGLLLAEGADPVLLTRATRPQVDAATRAHPDARVIALSTGEEALHVACWNGLIPREATVVIATAGTGDVPVALEAQAVLAAYGLRATLVSDVGVAGIHRVLAHQDLLADADAVIVVAGMEGALASVIAGLTRAPVVAVPTSTGYGASLEGVTALLAMHAGCSPGVTVVGIDNGFGAACAVVRLFAVGVAA